MKIATLDAVYGDSPWTKISNLLKPASIGMACFALGMWAQSIHDGSASIPWLHQQAAAFHKVQTVTLPKLAAVAGCQQKRADIAEGNEAAPNGLLNCESVGQALKKVPVPLAEHPASK